MTWLFRRRYRHARLKRVGFAAWSVLKFAALVGHPYQERWTCRRYPAAWHSLCRAPREAPPKPVHQRPRPPELPHRSRRPASWMRHRRTGARTGSGTWMPVRRRSQHRCSARRPPVVSPPAVGPDSSPWPVATSSSSRWPRSHRVSGSWGASACPGNRSRHRRRYRRACAQLIRC